MLSILIPAYNHAAYVEEAIASARRIDVPSKRIVVIDDASTDDTTQRVEAFLTLTGASDVEFIRKPVNRGLVDSINMFLADCDTEFVYMISSDDVAIPEGITELVRILRKKPSLHFIIGGGFNLMEGGRRTPIYGRKHDVLFTRPPGEIRDALFLLDFSPLLIQSTVFRLTAIREVGGFDPKIRSDDYALFAKLFMRLGTRALDYDFMPEVNCVEYRHHGSNSYRNLPRQAAAVRQVINCIAPQGLRRKAVGYKLAFYVLMALRQRQPKAALTTLRMARAIEIPWVGVGLVASLRHWQEYRV